MGLRQILPIDDPRLRQPSLPVDLSNGVPEEIVDLAADMLETSRVVSGAGMAAIQVGEPVRVFVMDLVSVAGDTMVFINPEIIAVSEEQVMRLEGCLSMPGVAVSVERPARVTVRFHNIEGVEQTYEATEFAAQCVQHEIDHLDGVRMLDRVSPLKRAMALKQFAKSKVRRRSVR